MSRQNRRDLANIRQDLTRSSEVSLDLEPPKTHDHHIFHRDGEEQENVALLPETEGGRERATESED